MVKRKCRPLAVSMSDTSLKDTLYALNSISKKAEHFLLKTHVPEKSAERTTFRASLSYCEGWASFVMVLIGPVERNPLTNFTLHKTQLSTALRTNSISWPSYLLRGQSELFGWVLSSLPHQNPNSEIKISKSPSGIINTCMKIIRLWTTHVRDIKWKTIISLCLRKVFI